ncbi:MAG: hypothetical protein HY769_03300 [Candidatus Stahlbacteria bacterium]|nr:hypothetical protein [Candidatus Stahlbacteria bacterium]
MNIRENLRQAFAIQKEDEKLNAEEKELIDKLANEIAKRRLDTVAITFLESVKYLNFISSQTMIFFKPIVDAIFPTQIYDKIQQILEKRGSIEYLIQAIERQV